jgi:RHH-type rel operon transcriptional repressor/antitoxin RelB
MLSRYAAMAESKVNSAIFQPQVDDPAFCYTCLARVRILALRLPPKVEKRLEALARKTGRTKSHYAKLAIVEFLDDQEDYLLAVARLERNLPGIPIEEVERRLGLGD